jgi:hypothetical protein
MNSFLVGKSNARHEVRPVAESRLYRIAHHNLLRSELCLPYSKERNAPDGEIAADMIGATTLAFGKPLLRSLCNHCADAIANNRIIEHWIEFVGGKRFLRLQNRMTARTIMVRFLR